MGAKHGLKNTQIRLMGSPNAVQAIAQQIARLYPIVSVSSPYLNNDGITVRVYVNIMHDSEEK